MVPYSNETLSRAEDLPMFRMKTISQVNRFICGIIGIPLNLLVVAVILRSKQLWSPRNIFWLAVTFFNLLALAQAITELCIYYLYRRKDASHETLCQFYSTIVGSPYALLLTGLMLSSLDRYLALSRHQFYKRYASPRNVILILLGVFCIIAGGQTAPYWLRIFNFSCKLRYRWLLITICFQGILSIICLFLQVRLYIFVRACIRYSPPDMAQSMELVNQQPSNSPSFPSHTMSCEYSDSQGNHQKLNGLEIRAARILCVGISPFCVVTLAICICAVMLVSFRHQGLDVVWIKFAMEIFREILIGHLIYIPAVFITNSREFRAAGRRFCRNRRPKPETQFG